MDLRKYLSLDRIVFGLTGLTGVVIGLLDYLQIIDWDTERYTKIILLGTGLLMITVVAEAIRRERALESIADQFGNPAHKYLDMDTEVPGAFERSLRQAEKSVNEAVLTWTVRSNQDRRDRYRNERDKRLRKHDITLRQLVVIHHLQHFEEVVYMLERFRNDDCYELRSYAPAALPMPALSLWSFDDTATYAGSFYVQSPPGPDKMLFVNDKQLNAWLLGYWQELWARADIIKQGLHVYDDKVRDIAVRLGISGASFDQLVNDARTAAASGNWDNGKLVSRP
jgi:hypothetical protein